MLSSYNSAIASTLLRSVPIIASYCDGIIQGETIPPCHLTIDCCTWYNGVLRLFIHGGFLVLNSISQTHLHSCFLLPNLDAVIP